MTQKKDQAQEKIIDILGRFQRVDIILKCAHITGTGDEESERLFLLEAYAEERDNLWGDIDLELVKSIQKMGDLAERDPLTFRERIEELKEKRYRVLSVGSTCAVMIEAMRIMMKGVATGDIVKCRDEVEKETLMIASCIARIVDDKLYLKNFKEFAGYIHDERILNIAHAAIQ